MTRMLAVAGAALGLALASAGTAPAQGLDFKPIDTNALVVQPTDAATGILSGTTRWASRVVANTIDGDGFVKTINNLLGRSAQSTSPYQSGMSALPLPTSYPSTRYNNSFVPRMPTAQLFGQSP